MVVAKLHVICGNCGSKDLHYERDDEVLCEEGLTIDNSSLVCGNCSTVHLLSDIGVKSKSRRSEYRT